MGRKFLISCVALVLVVAVGVVPAGATASLPLGFTDRFLFNVGEPTAVAFTPDGRMLVTTRPGQVWIAVNGVRHAAPALDLGSRICSNSERGLVGIAVDPAFTTNRFIYLYYTFKKFTGCPTNSPAQPVNRVSRFVLPNTNVIAPASEVVLVDNIPSPYGIHMGGDLNFGSDDMLYVSSGEAGCGFGTGSGCVKPRERNNLLGKMLRINRNGGVPADNPFVGSGTLPCAKTGGTTSGTTCREIYALGLRNPFRFAMDPNAPPRFYINDVGSNDWEEIDLGQAGADYGWQIREGHCLTGSATDCDPPPPGMTNPIFDYHHNTGCTSIVGGAFVPNDSGWPSAYLGKYLFADYVCGTIFRLDDQDSGFVMTPFATGLSIGSFVHIEFGPPAPTRRALYYTTFENGGEVRRIEFTSDGRPVAEMSAAPRSGLAPLTVNFDGSASGDPEGQSLTFLWDFGDGATSSTPSATTSHTYTADGTYAASLVVQDSGGLQSVPFSLSIVVGNTPPTPVITSPSANATFSVGQTITLSGSATDNEDGSLPNSALLWNVSLFHRDHRHPHFGPSSGNGLTFTAPAPEDLEAATNSHLIVELTVTDSDGISTTVSRVVQPQRVDLTFTTAPQGLFVTLQGQWFPGPSVITSWAGWPIAVTAPTPQGQYRFVSWSDGGLNKHTITTPSVPTTYTARFVRTL